MTGLAARFGLSVRRGREGPPWPALLVCATVITMAILGARLAPHDPAAADFLATLAPPAWMEGGDAGHLLGTDQLGRDVASRIVDGARVSVLTAAAAIFVGGSIGVVLGLAAGWSRGATDAVIMRVVDAFLALPFILMALAFVAALGTGLGNIVVVMIVTNWARYARIVRNEVSSLRERDFVTLARIAGVPGPVIAVRHLLPNVAGSVSVLAVLDVGRAIILESSLSFLGLGIQPPDVSWGLMLADGRATMEIAWWLTVFPGLAILFTVMAFNTVGDWLRVRFDPREGP